MSVSDTLLPISPAGESEGSYQLLQGYAYGKGGLHVNAFKGSPYCDRDIISLDIGPNQTRYKVHRILLSQSPELDAKLISKLWGEKINDTIVLRELNEATAHTLIHYLYTGRYQALEEQDGIAGYKLGTCVYCAASKYKLPGLAELAREKITSLGEELKVLEVLQIAREEAFPSLPDDETWFPAYIDDAIKAAYAEDSNLFLNPDFMDAIQGERKFRQVVLKAMVTYSKGLGPDVSTPSTETRPEHNGAKPEEEPKISEDLTTQIGGTGNKVDVQPQLAKTEHKRVDSVIETPPQPEPATDELGWGSSKTYQQQKMGKKVDHHAEESVKKEVSLVQNANKPDKQSTETSKKAEPEPVPKVDSVRKVDPFQKTDIVQKVDPVTLKDQPVQNVTTKAEISAPAEPKPVVEATPTPPETNEAVSPVDEAKTNGVSKKKSKKQKKKEAAAAKTATEKVEVVNGTGTTKQGSKV